VRQVAAVEHVDRRKRLSHPDSAPDVRYSRGNLTGESACPTLPC
jgi:hypothetical protein